MNYLAAGIVGTRHAILLEELIEKNPRNLHTAFQIILHRMTLQEVVGSIRTPRRSSQRYDRMAYSPRSPKYTSSQRYERRETRYSPQRQDRSDQMSSRIDNKYPPRTRPEKEFTKLNRDKSTILAVLKSDLTFDPQDR